MIFYSCRRYLNKSNTEDVFSSFVADFKEEEDNIVPAFEEEDSSSDPVTIRRRMLAAAAERRIHRHSDTPI